MMTVVSSTSSRAETAVLRGGAVAKPLGLCATVLVALLFVIGGAAQTTLADDAIDIRVRPIAVASTRDVLFAVFNGTSDVSVAVLKSDPSLSIEIYRSLGNGSSGYITASITNATRLYDLSLAMYSSNAYDVEITLRGAEIREPIQTMHLPANMTAQVNLQLTYIGYAAPVIPVVGIQFSPAFPLWSEAVYAGLLAMFLLTAFLDGRDLRIKRKRWDRLDTAALLLRYLFYAFVATFAVITGGIALEAVLSTAFSVALPILVGDWLVALVLLAIFGIIYGLGKWREIFENIDEEE